MTVFACQSSDHSVEKVRDKEILKENPFFNQDHFFPIFLGKSCLYLLEIALHFNKNSRIYFWRQMLTYVLSVSCMILEKNSTFRKKRVKKQFCLKNGCSFNILFSPHLFYTMIWALTCKNRHILPIFTENFMTFFLVV